MGLRKFAKTEVLESSDLPALLEAEALAAALQSSDKVQRRHSVWCAARGAATTALLLEHLEHEADADVQEALMVVLGRCEAEHVVPALLDQVGSENPLLRNRALEVLADFPDEVALHLPQRLESADADTRILLVNLMGELKHPQVPAWIHAMVQHEPHINVVGAALEVAAEVGDASMLAALESVAQRFHGDAYIAFAAAVARERIGVQ